MKPKSSNLPPEQEEQKAGRASDRSLVPIGHFDYDQIERNVFGLKSLDGIEPDVPGAKEMANRIMQALLEWVWQDGSKNADGLQIRAMIICWVFLPQLEPYSLTDLANAFGKDKQSPGRWVVEFQNSFPFVRTPHMK